MSRTLCGSVYSGDDVCAHYFVSWTIGHVGDLGANIDLALGPWGKDSQASDRVAVSLLYRLFDSGPAVMVIDADERDIAKSEGVSRGLKRDEVIGRPLAKQMFAIFDAIALQDDRLSELDSDAGNPDSRHGHTD
jgi:hypothetical protein